MPVPSGSDELWCKVSPLRIAPAHSSRLRKCSLEIITLNPFLNNLLGQTLAAPKRHECCLTRAFGVPSYLMDRNYDLRLQQMRQSITKEETWTSHQHTIYFVFLQPKVREFVHFSKAPGGR